MLWALILTWLTGLRVGDERCSAVREDQPMPGAYPPESRRRASTLAGPPMAPMGLPMMLVRTWFSSLPCGTLAAGPLPATG